MCVLLVSNGFGVWKTLNKLELIVIISLYLHSINQ